MNKMAADTQLTRGYVQVDGGQLYYETAGEGHPLVLLHAGIANSRMWDEQFRIFFRHYRVIRCDARGHGKSRTGDVSFSHRKDLLALLDHLGVRKAYLLGLSSGGRNALDFALEFPDRVDALILAAAGLGGFEPEPGQIDAQELQIFAEMDELWENGEFERLSEMEMRMFVDGPGQPSARVSPAIREWLGEMSLDNFTRRDGRSQPLPLDPPALGRLGEVAVPTLVIVGDLDASGTRRMADLIAQGIPGARKVVFNGAAHMLNVERSQEFNQLVLGFLGNLERAGAEI